ncbi:M23 family metallopeptidase [Lachnospiraceae bacterium ZAX-1]
MKMAVIVEAVCLLTIVAISMKHNSILSEIFNNQESKFAMRNVAQNQVEEEYIKWVDFNVSYEALETAYNLDVETYKTKHHVNFIELLAYTAAKNGGTFPSTSSREIQETGEALSVGTTTMETLTLDMKYYPYYLEAYTAVLGGYVGEYEIQVENDSTSQPTYEKKYGLMAFSPIAKGFPYCDYDDFGVSRTYGYARPHLGHDFLGAIGTPIIAVESGYIEAIGWNQYGGWRIGIRSFDKKRYYYYAHLRQNYPFREGLKEGSTVTAGDVIGYMGHTGYSKTENVNNIDSVHLHFGIQLIFDESQKEGNSEIWIDPYQLVRFLCKNRTEALKVGESKEWRRVQEMKDPAVEKNRQEEEKR